MPGLPAPTSSLQSRRLMRYCYEYKHEKHVCTETRLSLSKHMWFPGCSEFRWEDFRESELQLLSASHDVPQKRHCCYGLRTNAAFT